MGGGEGIPDRGNSNCKGLEEGRWREKCIWDAKTNKPNHRSGAWETKRDVGEPGEVERTSREDCGRQLQGGLLVVWSIWEPWGIFRDASGSPIGRDG